MAFYVSDSTLNEAADKIVDATVEVRLHSNSPGNAGTNNRIGSVSADVAASGWTAASGGIAETSADTLFGVLDASNAQTVRAYSLWKGGAFKGWADVYQVGTTTVGVAVAAGESFKLNSGQVQVEITR